MTRRTRSRPAGPSAIALLALLGGCATGVAPPESATPPAHAQDGATVPATRFAGVERRARAEAARPVNEARLLPTPPGLDARLVDPLDRSDPASPALASLAATLDRLGRGDLVEPEANPPPAPDVGTRAAALRLYASGRTKLLAGNVGGAILDLESASRLDPTSGAVWRELGDAQLQQGKRLAAASSFRQAIRRGLREPRTLWQLGRQAQRGGRATEAVRFLAAARAADPELGDPTLPFLINADLADALITLQCYAAAAEALDAALDFPEQFSSQTRLRLEFGELLRRRGDMLRDLGDLYCRLGQYDKAAEAYALSSLSPSLDQGAAMPRLVHVSLRRGRPSEAALTLLEYADRSHGFPDERTIALIRFLAERSDAGPALADGLGQIRSGIGPGITPSVAGALTRAQAAALGRSRGAAVLLSHLAEHPDDGAAMSDLVETPDLDTAGLAEELTRLVRRAPGAADQCANAALARGGDADPLLARLAERDDDAAVALRAILLAKLGKTREGAALVIGREWKPPFESAGPECEAVLAAACGRYDAADAAYQRLRANPHADTRALYRAALSLQRGVEALEILRAALADAGSPDARRVDLLVAAAGLCAATGHAAEAETYLRRALAADPHDERPYAGLFRLYSPAGPLADQNKLADVIRGIRDAAPAARVLRLAAAQELADRRLDTQAEQLLLGLLEDNIADADAGSLLTAIWDRRSTAPSPAGATRALEPGALATAEAWLRAQIAVYPEVRWLWTSLARVLWAEGNAAAAESLLAERLEVRPVDELAVMRETILREGLSRRDEADAAALARVRTEPRTVGASLQLVDLLVRTDKRDEALAVLRDSVPRTITLTDDQQEALAAMLTRVASKYAERPLLTDASSSALLEEVASRNVRLSPQLHAFRIAVLASRVDDDPASVRRAVDLGAAQHPGLASEMYKAAALVYLQTEKPKRAIPFLRLYAEHNQDRNLELMFQLVRVVILEGENDDLQWLLARVNGRAEIEAILRRMYRDTSLRIPADDAKLRAEFAYRLGGQLAFRNRSDLAATAYKAALTFDPDNAWTMNDWGYQLLEGGGDFERAVSLIEGAYARLPSEANIIDSLGWVRYNQGIFLDDAGPPPREGAVTLFKKAAATELGSKNATVLDHLGDASWAAGLKDGATAAWKQAEEIAAADVMELRRAQGISPETMARATGELEAIRTKLRAAQAGETPVIAKRRGT